MKKQKDDATVCERFCSWYRPGKNEAFECQGAVVLRRLREGGRRFDPGRHRLPGPRPGAMSALDETVCRVCGFAPADCDHAGGAGGALPCGGFILLSHLLEEGEITLDEIRKACE